MACWRRQETENPAPDVIGWIPYNPICFERQPINLRTVTSLPPVIPRILAICGLFLSPLAAAEGKRAGADWWSLQPLAKVVPPDAGKADRGSNSIDAFIAAKLESRGLTPSPPADPQAQIRRMYFDLTGMPPSAEAVRAFEDDPSEAA